MVVKRQDGQGGIKLKEKKINLKPIKTESHLHKQNRTQRKTFIELVPS